MFPPDSRSLSGDGASPQHLVELRVPAAGLTLAAAAPDGRARHLLLLNPNQRLACFHDGLAWHLDGQQLVWLLPGAPLTLRPAGLRPVELLAWCFYAETLPADLRSILPPPAIRRAPVHGPIPLTPSMQTILLALQGCPVAPSLRTFWSTAKLMELLTLVLPEPAGAPPAPGDVSPPPRRPLHPAIRAALDYMSARLAEPIGLPEIAAAAHVSPSHLSRLFTAEMGHGPTQHLRRLRLDHAAALLRSGRANVTEAAYAAGYASLGQFSRAFSEQHGVPPSSLLRS